MPRTGRPKGVVSRSRVVICPCGTAFETSHSQGKYCSMGCKRNGMQESWRKYGRANRQERKQYHRKHYTENKPRTLARTRAYQSTERGKQVAAESNRKQKKKFPEKYAARQAVHAALLSGRLTKQSCKCGSMKVQAHHTDYTQPLRVEWLCDPCHRHEHRKSA